MSERYGDHLVTLADIVPCRTSCEEPEVSLEGPLLHVLAQRPQSSICPMRRKQGLPVNEPGKLYAQAHQSITAWLDHVVLARNFDAVVYLPDAEALP